LPGIIEWFRDKGNRGVVQVLMEVAVLSLAWISRALIRVAGPFPSKKETQGKLESPHVAALAESCAGSWGLAVKALNLFGQDSPEHSEAPNGPSLALHTTGRHSKPGLPKVARRIEAAWCCRALTYRASRPIHAYAFHTLSILHG
jgi:hypothetical protein